MVGKKGSKGSKGAGSTKQQLTHTPTIINLQHQSSDSPINHHHY